MKKRTTSLLLAGAIAALLAILLSMKPASDRQHYPAPVSVPAAGIHSIEVRIDDEAHWLLRKQDNQWTINTDTEKTADNGKVNALLASLAQPLARCYAKEEFGDNESSISFDISIEVRINGRLEFSIADYAALDHRRYLLTETDVCLVNELFAWQLMRPADDYLQTEPR